MRAPLVVFAVGNPSRGDDALGPILLARLAAWLAERDFENDFELIEDFQLNIEHALDLQGRELALFIDAGQETPAPFVFKRISASTAIAHTTHALPPEAVLQVYCQTEGHAPPPAYVLCVCGECFDLGEGLSPAAQSRVAEAMAWLERLIGAPDPAAWAALATQGQAEIANKTPRNPLL